MLEAPMSSNVTRDDADMPVGALLASLRRRAGLSGLQLGQLAGISQAKISKLETGARYPSPQDIEQLAPHLRASAAEINRLLQLAGQGRDHMTDYRFGRKDPATWQHEIANLESAARVVRVFHPGVLGGLLQTSEYARAVIGTVDQAWRGAADASAGTVAKAVSARMGRQVILHDPTKEFHFVVPETAVRNVLSRPEEMLGQLERLGEVSRQTNVRLSMIPEREPWPFPPYHGFSVLDDRYVIIDLFNTVVVTHGRSDIRLYRRVFDELERRATTDIEPILADCRRRYLEIVAAPRPTNPVPGSSVTHPPTGDRLRPRSPATSE
jgi:transcriptional regulator with XRE-family HTH domain